MQKQAHFLISKLVNKPVGHAGGTDPLKLILDRITHQY